MHSDHKGFADLLGRVRQAVAGPGRRDDALAAVCKLLGEGVQRYDWVGFYVVDEAGTVLDIDSHTPAAFTDQDREFLEHACRTVSHLFRAPSSA